MKIIPASFEILDMASGSEILKKIELAGRTCYKSEYSINDGSSQAFCGSIIKRGHESVLEHASATVKIICDRGVLAELTRHRIASYSCESSRYCNYSSNKFGKEITVIMPCFLKEGESLYHSWYAAMAYTESIYNKMIEQGATPQEARSVLPNSLKTEIVITANMREWRHIFKMRCDKAAHPQMREIMLPLLQEFYNRVPILFEDIYQYGIESGWYQINVKGK